MIKRQSVGIDPKIVHDIQIFPVLSNLLTRSCGQCTCWVLPGQWLDLGNRLTCMSSATNFIGGFNDRLVMMSGDGGGGDGGCYVDGGVDDDDYDDVLNLFFFHDGAP